MLRIQSLVPLKSLSIVSIATMLAASSAQAGSLATPIVGGKAVAPGDWPDVVAIELRDGGVCTGTLLAADLVLTAAHCIEANPTKVIVGSVDIDQPDGERRAVKWSRAYPSWLDAYDVGIVMLEHPVQAKQRAIAKDCTETDHLASGTPLTVVGFGLTRQSGEGYNTRLHEATVRFTTPPANATRHASRRSHRAASSPPVAPASTAASAILAGRCSSRRRAGRH